MGSRTGCPKMSPGGTKLARVLRMPEVADDPTSATLTAWLVGESGDFVGAQSIATVETDSSVLSIEVAEPGVLIRSLVAPGDHVEPGRPLAVLGAPGEVIEDVEKLMVQLGLAVSPDTSFHARAVAAHDELFATTWPPHEHDAGEPETDLDHDGVDVELVAAPALAPSLDPVLEPAARPVSEPRDEPATLTTDQTTEPGDEPVVVRRVVTWADRLAEAVVDAVLVAEPRASARPASMRQVQLRDVVRADELLQIVAKLDTVSLMALVVKAVAVTTRQVPLRPGLPGGSGIADVAVQRWTTAGTVAPVVHVAGLMSVSSLTTTLADLDARARHGRLAAGELEPASVTIVDLGTEGVAEGYLDATVAHPAVLTLGSVVVRPVVDGGQLVPGRVITISLSCDTQRIDSGAAARWMAHLAGLLENPLQFLT